MYSKPDQLLLGINWSLGIIKNFLAVKNYFGAVLQYPDGDGKAEDYSQGSNNHTCMASR